MSTVRLRGISRHGKNRISQHGDLWVVKAVRESVKFPTSAPGPFLSLGSVTTEDWRWISEVNDPNFEIVEEVNGA